MRVVLDTDILVAAFRSNLGESRQVLLAGLDKKIVLLASVPLMLEYEAVLTRPEQLSASALDATDVHRVLDALASVIEPVHLRFHWRPMLRDPGDEMVLETAANGHANRLVSFNVRHFVGAASRFGIPVVAPGVLWREIKGTNR
jgi:putative PIN family toxin of toxin-antitoxin system